MSSQSSVYFTLVFISIQAPCKCSTATGGWWLPHGWGRAGGPQMTGLQKVLQEFTSTWENWRRFRDMKAFGLSFREAETRGRQDKRPGHRLPGVVESQN